MKKFAIYLAFVALLCTLAVAHEGHEHIKGKVTAINGSEITVQLEQGENKSVVVTNETKLMKGDDDVKLTDLKVGDGVFVHGAVKDGKIQAEEIRIRIPKAAASK